MMTTAKVTRKSHVTLLREVVCSSRPIGLQVEEGGGFILVTSSFSKKIGFGGNVARHVPTHPCPEETRRL